MFSATGTPMRWTLLLLVALGPALAAQDPQDQDPAPLQAPASAAPPAAVNTGLSVVASVNGDAITSTDIAFHARMVSGAPSGSLEPSLAHIVRRQLGEQLLMASEAARLEVVLTDTYVDDFFKDYRGGKPDYDALAVAAGTTVDRQRELVRRAALADVYLYHRVGIWAEFGQQIKPDPVLAHLVEVTPKDLRDLFREQRERFELPPTVTYDFYPCTEEQTAVGVRETLLAGMLPSTVRSGQETAPLEAVPQVFAFSPELVSFLQQGQDGAVSDVFFAEMGWVVFVIQERALGRGADFAEVQEELRRQMRMTRLDLARRQLVAELVRSAVFWPQELFDEEIEPAKVGGRGAASTLRKP